MSRNIAMVLMTPILLFVLVNGVSFFAIRFVQRSEVSKVA
jgi:hypothetical protein